MGCGASSSSSDTPSRSPPPATGDGKDKPPEPVPGKDPAPNPAPAPAPGKDPSAEPTPSKPPGETPVPVPAPVPAGNWWEVPLPDVVVVRKECRKMSNPEQQRYAAAVMKMRENVDAKPGTSQFFRLAVIHGGLHPLPRAQYPEFCAHRRECFPGWHRPYILDFERTMRRADMALGGDGNIGLPYWDWTDIEVNGEVMPGIVRSRLMEEFPDDFFPVKPSPGRHGFKMSATRDDARLKAMLSDGAVAEGAKKCLHSLRHSQHATTAFSDFRFVSLESPHNSIHGMVGGIMASFQSSFHPVFWLHHCNIDRIHEKYIQIEPDSAEEFQRHQRRLDPQPAAGFPEGPWGPYLPFAHPKTGEPFHAKDCYDAKALGFSYDELPAVQPPQMREPPWFAVFRGIDIRELKYPRLLHVYVGPKAEPWTWKEVARPEDHPGFAGTGSVFFFDSPDGCDNCKYNPIVDIYVDITAALRAAKLRPSRAALHVKVEDCAGNLEDLSDTPVPVPELKGPRFSSMAELLSQGIKPGDDADEDVKRLQELLIDHGVTDPETVGGDFGTADGAFGPMTEAAIKKLQKAAGIKEDGIVGPVTKRVLLMGGLKTDYNPDARPSIAAGKAHSWTLKLDTVPRQLSRDKVVADLKAAFAPWVEATNINFQYEEVPTENGVTVEVSFAARSTNDQRAFDGPGGMLAEATPQSITFDADERWELQDAKHPHRDFMDWEDQYFQLLPVAMHEIGHVLGLSHTSDPRDVMSPYYLRDRIILSETDIARVKEVIADPSSGIWKKKE